MIGTADADDVLAQIQRWRAAGRRTALATVVATWGSSPRPIGSQLAVDENGSIIGSVSGACVEGAVVTEAITAWSAEPRDSWLSASPMSALGR